MSEKLYTIESATRFSDSLLWQLNREYYQSIGIEAWSDGKVPHQITSNSLVGKTYAELILAFLIDLSEKGDNKETIYILEMGAGHGRLAFHILKHLEKLIALTDKKLAPYCYIISDIVEKNLVFFKEHPQLIPYYESGVLDYAYFDAIGGKEIHLRYADKLIKAGELKQPVFALANYFFDSIQNDLFHINHEDLSVCSISLESTEAPTSSNENQHLSNIQASFHDEKVEKPFYDDQALNDQLENYRSSLNESYILFPKKSIDCIDNLRSLSKKGLILLSMDKGYQNLSDLDHLKKPDIVTHGSFSLWVNFHALGRYCEKEKGKTLFTDKAPFNLQLNGFLFLEDAENYTWTNAAYQRFVNDFGPDDYNNLKKMVSNQVRSMDLSHLLSLLRLSSYDSSMFIKVMPRIKQLIQQISKVDRIKIAKILPLVWDYYFNINEKRDLALTIAGIYFDLSFYENALIYYQYSIDVYGVQMDTSYNKILCHYQLRQDKLFSIALEEARTNFPESELLVKLDALDLTAS